MFVNHPDPQNLEDFALSLGLHAVQLHGNETPDYCSMIHRVKVIKAFRVDSSFRVEIAAQLWQRACFFWMPCSTGPVRRDRQGLRLESGVRRECVRIDRHRGRLDARKCLAKPSHAASVRVDVASGVESSPEKKITKKCGASSKRFDAPMSRLWVNHERSFWSLRRTVCSRNTDASAGGTGGRLRSRTARSCISGASGVSVPELLGPPDAALSSRNG